MTGKMFGSRSCFRALSLCLLVGLLGGCANNQSTVYQQPQAQQPLADFPVMPAKPDGLRLGASYTSALNELCYEAFSLDGLSVQARAYCWRSNSWLLLPDIYRVPPRAELGREAARDDGAGW